MLRSITRLRWSRRTVSARLRKDEFDMEAEQLSKTSYDFCLGPELPIGEFKTNQSSATSEDDQPSSPTNTQDDEPSDDDVHGKSGDSVKTRIRISQEVIIRRTYMKYLCREILREFKKNRFWLNHFEFVDFTVFEYGDRTYYLIWRVFAMVVLALLSYVFLPGIEVKAHATPVAGLVFMHVWLYVLLLIHSVVEVIALTWLLCTVDSSVLGRIHHTPWHFKLLWLIYNSVFPNLMSCSFMYYVIIQDMDTYNGDFEICNAVLASFVSIHVSVTASPSRLAHFIHPLGFNVFHILFITIYQLAGFTNPRGNNYVYQEIDWSESGLLSVVRVLIWIGVTCICHVLIVMCSWCRRLVYRYKRSKTFRCVYGITTDEYSLFHDDDYSDSDYCKDKFQSHIACC